MHVYLYSFFSFFLDLYINQQGLALLPSAGHALPSHYIGSGANHSLCVCLSQLISLFLFPPPLAIFLFHSLRQLPSPTCPQSALIIFSSGMYSISPVLLSIFLLLFFPPLPTLSHSSVLPPPVSSHFLRSPPSLIAYCLLLLFFVSTVKDLDTEKYVHLVSISLYVTRMFLYGVCWAACATVSQPRAGLTTGGEWR